MITSFSSNFVCNKCHVVFQTWWDEVSEECRKHHYKAMYDLMLIDGKRVRYFMEVLDLNKLLDQLTMATKLHPY